MTVERSSETTTVHTRLLSCMLAVDDSYAYWQNLDLDLAPSERPRAAFERRWFGLKSEARVRTLLVNMTARFDAFPEALALLRRLRAVQASLRASVCHVHTQLADPIYRSFTGEYLPQRRVEGYRTLDCDTVARWVDALEPGRWSTTTCQKFASNLLGTAFEAGLLKRAKDPRELAQPNATDVALGYALYLLRSVRFEGALGEDPYTRSLGLNRESLVDALRGVPGITYRDLGGIQDLDWHYPSLLSWGTEVLGARV